MMRGRYNDRMQRLRNILVWLLKLPIQAYRRLISPWLGLHCRFTPSCSAYALQALEVHGPVKGLWLAARRILRCHPLGGFGEDPVPPAGQQTGTRRPADRR